MNRFRQNNRPLLALIVFGILSVEVAAAYVLSYVIGCDTQMTDGVLQRTFSAEWKCALYAPAARVESALTGTPVCLFYPIRYVGDPGFHYYP